MRTADGLEFELKSVCQVSSERVLGVGSFPPAARPVRGVWWEWFLSGSYLEILYLSYCCLTSVLEGNDSKV